VKLFKQLRNLAVLSAATLTSVAAMAEGTVTVEKVQGSKAIVKFEGMKPKAGESYDLGGGDSGGGGGGNGQRPMYLDLSTDLFNKTIADGEVSTTTLGGTLGWNMGQFEVGIPVALSFTGAPEGGESTIGATFGVDFDFNFTENKPGELMVPFIHGRGDFGLLKSGDTVKFFDFQLGIGIKYFLNDQVAILGGLNFTMAKFMIEGATMGKSISLPIGIRAYF
jgi:hypothetical protein